MQKNIIESIQDSLLEHIKNRFNLDESNLNNIEINLQADASKQQFGDITTNCALVLAKSIGKNPREIAQSLLDFNHKYVQKVEIAGPGFINIFLSIQAIQELAKQIYSDKDNFFKLDIYQHPGKTNPKKAVYDCEFVSANPTGPLHLGHGRGAIIGDVLGNIINFIGNSYTKEFYINDAGSQIQKLGNSFKIRCAQELGSDTQIPEDGYHGTYLTDLAKKAILEFGKDVLNKPENWFCQYAKEYMLSNIKGTLEDYGVFFDIWFSEKTLHDSGAIEKAINKLKGNGYIYESEGAVWFFYRFSS